MTDMGAFEIILWQLASFFIMLVIGYIASRTSVMSKDFLDSLSGLVMKVLLPICIFSNAVNGTSRAELLSCWPILLLSVGMYAGLIAVFAVVSRWLVPELGRRRIFQAAMIFGNAGFIGIPLLLALYPARGAIFIALMSIVDQLLLWTYGAYLTMPHNGRSIKLSNFVNPALCSVLLALLFLLLDIPVPDVIEQPLLSVGRAATPMSLIYIGGLLYYSNWKPVLKQKELYIGVGIKMLLFPVLYWLAASRLCHDAEMVRTLAIVSALPTMTTVAMLSKANGEHGDYGLGTVIATTIMSLVTLTVVSYIIL